MNQDTTWQIIRYLLLIAGGFLVSQGYSEPGQIEAAVGALGIVFTFAWGVYVKWRTTPVLDTVIAQKRISSIDSATGEGIPAPAK